MTTMPLGSYAHRIAATDLLRERMTDPKTAAPEPRFATRMFPLDEVMGGGLRRQDLVLVAGRPGAGKTVMAMQWARAVAMQRVNAIYVCYEHSPEHMFERFVALEAACAAGERNDAPALERVTTTPNALDELFERVKEYAWRISFVPASGRYTDVDAIERLVAENEEPGDTVVFVDYLQKVPTPRGKFANEDERTAYVVESLKDLAIRHNVAVVALAGVDRDSLRERRLRMHHMRGSASLMYEADIALVLNEKSRAVSKAHLAYDAVRAERAKHQIVVSVEKNRNGIADVDMEFTKNFANYALDPNGSFLAESLVDDILYGE
jgi:replicative DNA helicase